MAEELEGAWRTLKLIENLKDTIETEDIQGRNEPVEGQAWLVGKLLSNRLFNKDAMLGHLGAFGALFKITFSKI